MTTTALPAVAIPAGRVDRTTLRRILLLFRPYRTTIAIFFAVVTTASCVGAATPLILARLVDTAIPSGDAAAVLLLCLAIVGIGIVEGTGSLWASLLAARAGTGVVLDLRTQLFRHLQQLPLGFFSRTHTGSLVARVNTDVEGAQQALSLSLGALFSHLLTVIITVGSMIALEWRAAFVVLLLVPALFVPTMVAGRKFRALTWESMNASASLASELTDRFDVSGAMLSKLFGDPARDDARFGAQAKRLRAIAVRNALLISCFSLALGLVATVAIASIYLVGGFLASTQQMSLGVLVALAAYLARLLPPLMGLANARVQVLSAIVSFERAFELLDFQGTTRPHKCATPAQRFVGRIDFDDVWFRYPGVEAMTIPSLARAPTNGPCATSEFVLRGITATVEPGETVAVVGASGAGKTTLALLIPRLYDVTRGAIRIDGKDVRELDPQALRAAIGVVPQEPALLHDTVAANLRLADPDASQQALERACRAARIHQVIASTPDGYETVVGARGHRLSGGEKQRLAIARLLLADPRIIILDEATSHLDADNEAGIQDALATALSGRTAIVIAHRMSTITTASQILVVQEGRIVQSGRHRELIASGGAYAALYGTSSHAADPPDHDQPLCTSCQVKGDP